MLLTEIPDRSMNSSKQRIIVDMLEREPSVLCVNDVKSMVEVRAASLVLLSGNRDYYLGGV